MSFRAMVPLRLFLVAFLGLVAGLSTLPAQVLRHTLVPLTMARVGQDAGSTAQRVIQFYNEEAITTSFVEPPNAGSVSGDETSSGGNQQWFKVEFHYSVNPEKDKAPFVDEVEFKVWIEGRDLYAANAPGNQGVAVCLTGSVSYVNLAAAHDAYGVFYVHPSALDRYCGAGTFEDFDRKFNIHIDALVGGKLVDYYDKHKDAPDWYKAPVAVPNFVFRQSESPFALADVKRYPEIKLEAKQ